MVRLSKEMYVNERAQQSALYETVKSDPYRLHYHLMPPAGWMNDPNGLCQVDGLYHIYYQYSPFEPLGGAKIWGHYTTRDLIHFRDHEPFIFADWKYDARGVYSGSAFVEDGIIHFFYTGYVKNEDGSREQNTIHMTSTNGFDHTDKEIVMTNADYPHDLSWHVRDPKIFKKDGMYYMVLGARDQHDHGLILLYRSDHLSDWQLHDRLSMPDFGYMWECPDLFELDGELFLVFSPQGLEEDGMKYRNVYQTGYCRLHYDFKTKECSFSGFEEIDHGFDYYAPQSFLDEKGRRIQFGWMGIGDIPYSNEPTVEKGWQHALTLPRVLHAKEGRLYQMPAEEIDGLRKNKTCFTAESFAWKNTGPCFEIDMQLGQSVPFEIRLYEDIVLSYDGSVFALKMKESGLGRDWRAIETDEIKDLRIYADTSSLEIFINDGRYVFTSRMYPQGEANVVLNMEGKADIQVYEMDRIIVEEKDV
ncbi:glycoside hydrolase family 32 protein [uncultured Dubosiella sp.]|uniref:glycoside hydrolase family 32 protein n=1 Tax=uncultured Dubosiella sp. TaxID=1937011 RepID=UPI002629DC5C|nr:glycoside hydrolase family 32 protein [uncultured Dubosiella sp.]